MSIRFDLYSGETPTVDLHIDRTDMFLPFRHRAELYTRNESHPFWSFEDMDDAEFPPDARRVHASDWILRLDPEYTHGTTIRCTHGGIHGLNLTVHTTKQYRGFRRPARLQFVHTVRQDEADALHAALVEEMALMEARWPARVTQAAEAQINPEGIVSEYVMRRCSYRHVP
jgi:hypothetical protein